MPRFRFTIRRLMGIIALAGLSFGVATALAKPKMQEIADIAGVSLAIGSIALIIYLAPESK